jgi:hypothetical protein
MKRIQVASARLGSSRNPTGLLMMWFRQGSGIRSGAALARSTRRPAGAAIATHGVGSPCRDDRGMAG